MCLLHDSGLSNNLWENNALADKSKEMKNGKKKWGLAEQFLLHALISASFGYSVLWYKEMPARLTISRQQFTCCKCCSGGGWGDRAPVPWALQTLLGRSATAACHRAKLPALLAAALEMGSAGPACCFPSISHTTEPLARSKNQPLYCNWAFTHLYSVQHTQQWWHGHSKPGLGWR